MPAKVVVSGTLYRMAERRALAPGKSCVTATLLAMDGEHARLWPIVAFSEAVQSELMRLAAGDALAVQGSLRAELYDKNGETQLSFGVIAEHAVGMRQPDKGGQSEVRSTAPCADVFPSLTSIQ
ncbi:MAG: single-stranded DNA-binding protein [Methylocapsa sp.]|nr:single-stranded DNA-binding protein [Methylocapsa sp.]